METKEWFIDPPEGWKYGFPKAISSDVEDVNAWLVDNNYPEKLIEAYGEHFHVRYWK